MLFKELKALASSSVWVLPARSALTKPFAHNAINNALKTSLQNQEIPAFTIHDLRRTASTLLHEACCTPPPIRCRVCSSSGAMVNLTGDIRTAGRSN